MDSIETRDTGSDEVASIGAGVTITGEVECATDLEIEGRVNGDVRCPTLLLAEGGLVTGSIYAERVRVSGQVDGSVKAGDLAIEATGRIKGDATYTRLKVSAGGIVQGNMQHSGETAAPVETGGLKLVESVADPMTQVRRVFGE